MTDDRLRRDRRIRLAVINDFEVIVAGVAQMLRPYADRIDVVELDVNEPVSQPVDVAFVDSFAHGEAHSDDVTAVLDNPLARAVVMFTWNMDQRLIDIALARGLRGYLSKHLAAAEIFDAIIRVHAGEIVVAGQQAPGERRRAVGDWPGREHDLTEREAEVLVLLTAGLSNPDIAAKLFVSVNSVKTHVRNVYRKIGVDTRTKAALWGVEHGFQREQRRIDQWRSGHDRSREPRADT